MKIIIDQYFFYVKYLENDLITYMVLLKNNKAKLYIYNQV